MAQMLTAPLAQRGETFAGVPTLRLA